MPVRIATMQMDDDDERREQRGGQPATPQPFNPMPNRDQRRRIAKKNKMFKIDRKAGWENMNSRNVNLQTIDKEADATDTH